MLNLKDLSICKNKVSPFMRSGTVGDWKNYFSAEQSAYVEDKCREFLEPHGLTFVYEL